MREFVKKIIGCSKDDSITNVLWLKKVKLEKLIYRKTINCESIKKCFSNLGIKTDDNLIVHCSWREFFNYHDTPNSVIDILVELIGPNGNLAMPCYGKTSEIFDVVNTPSTAGVLSEVFRTDYPVERSNCSHFSMAVLGFKAQELTKDQINSVSGFDERSTYAKCLAMDNSKIVFLGLGKYPLQITQMHIEEYKNKDVFDVCKDLFKEKYKAILLDTPTKGQTTTRIMLKRKSGRPNMKNRRMIYKNLDFYRHSKIGNIDVVVVDADDARKSIDECLKNGYSFSK